MNPNVTGSRTNIGIHKGSGRWITWLWQKLIGCAVHYIIAAVSIQVRKQNTSFRLFISLWTTVFFHLYLDLPNCYICIQNICELDCISHLITFGPDFSGWVYKNKYWINIEKARIKQAKFHSALFLSSEIASKQFHSNTINHVVFYVPFWWSATCVVLTSEIKTVLPFQWWNVKHFMSMIHDYMRSKVK